MNNEMMLNEIKAKIEAMKAQRDSNTKVDITNLDEVKKNLHVSVSDAQCKIYVKLCTEKRVQLNPKYRSFDGRKGGEMDKEIQNLIKLPTIKLPSEGQVKMLTELCERNNWDIPAYAHLTGGRDGSMSGLIAELVLLEKEMIKLAPLTEKQAETILEMYFCVDVDFSDLHEQYGIVYTGSTNNGKLLWTRPSQETIASTLTELVTFQMASNFIYKYQLEFFKWTKNRCSASQMDKIRRLQEQCKMQPMEEYQLMQFDKKTADMYITNLNLVRRDADIVKFRQEECVEDINRCNTVAKAVEEDIVRKDNLLYSLYAMCGMSGRDESESSIDVSANDEIIADLAKVVIGICGSKAVMSLLAETYDDKELETVLALMYPKSENTVDIDNMSIEELEAYMESLTA